MAVCSIIVFNRDRVLFFSLSTISFYFFSYFRHSCVKIMHHAAVPAPSPQHIRGIRNASTAGTWRTIYKYNIHVKPELCVENNNNVRESSNGM